MVWQKKSLNGVCISHMNVHFLINKTNEVATLLDKPNKLTHIIGLSETRLSSEVDNDILFIQNYSTPFRRDIGDHPKHRGLAYYVHDSIRHVVSRRTDLEHARLESMWLQIEQTHAAPRLVGFIYRNPGLLETSWVSDFIDMMDEASAITKDILLLGDFNIHHPETDVNWAPTIKAFGLEQLITEPTRVCTTRASMLDHIYKTADIMVTDVEVSNDTISDHYTISCTWIFKLTKTPTKGHTTVEYRSFKHFNDIAFLYDLSCVDFSMVYNCANPDEALYMFYNALMSVINVHAPLRLRRVKFETLPSWLKSNIIHEMELRDYYKRNKMSQYKRQRNRVTDLIRDAKRNYFNSLLQHEKNTKHIWRAINVITNKKKSQQNIIPLTPDTLNSHFLAIPPGLANSEYGEFSNDFIIEDTLQQFCQSKLKNGKSFEIPLLAVHEVGKLISDLKNKKSMGPDNLTAYLLKLTLPYIVEPLTYIYNLSIQLSIFPSLLKHAKVIPLPKSKDLNDPGNYRPISILSVLSKPLERHIHNHLLLHLENNSLLVPSQSGFRPNHSCQTALTKMCDTWLSAINESAMIGAVFLDFRKAFDTVNHYIMIKKLEIYLGNSLSTSFFKSYLEDRHQYVLINGKRSKKGTIVSGVPQGSILGPLLFSLYINDLPLLVSNNTPQSSKCFRSNDCSSDTQCNVTNDLFADDASLYSTNKDLKTLEKSLQKSLDLTTKWCKDNRMVIHPDKTKSMIIATRQKLQREPLKLKLSLGQKQIEQVQQHRVLGVMLDSEFKWLPHLDNVLKSVSRNLYLLSQLRHVADTESLMMFFYAHILPHVNYASNIWDGCADQHMKKLNSLYRRAFKLINVQKEIPTDQKISELGAISLEKQLLLNKAVLVYKVINGLSPNYLDHLCRKPTRRYDSVNLIVPFARIDLYKTSFSFSGSLLWNSIPKDIRNKPSLPSFKKALKRHMFGT